MSVSLNFRNASYDEANNTKHNYTFYSNLGIDLYDYLVGREFTIKDLIQTKDGKLTPNSASLKFEFQDIERVKANILEMEMDSEILIQSEMEKFNSWNFISPLWLETSLPYTRIIQKGDEFHISDLYNLESHQFATLIVDEIKPSFSATKIGLDVTLKDKTAIAYEKKFEKDIVYQNLDICNTAQTEISAMHILAKYLPFGESELDFDDLTTPDGSEHLKLSFLYCKKGTNIIEKIAEVARAGSCSQFKVTNEELIVRGAFAVNANESYTFDDTNILGEIQEELIKKTGDTFQLDYDKYWYGDEQIVFALIGTSSTATETNAKIKLEPGAVANYKVKFITDLIKEYNSTPEIEMTDADGNSVMVDYTLDIDLSGGTLKLENKLDKNVWINKFIIRGIPLNCQSGNSTKVTGEADENPLVETNESVQNTKTAELFAKWNHYIKCRDWVQLSFNTNVSTWLEAGRIVKLNHGKYSDEERTLWIQEVTHNPNSAAVRAFIYQEFEVSQADYTNEETSTANYDFLSTKDYIDNNAVTLNDEIPEMPMFELVASFNSFEIVPTKPSDKNIKGYKAYITGNGVDKEVFFTTTTKTIRAFQGVEYTVQLTCITYNEVESLKAEEQKVVPLKVEMSSIEGLTEIKSELNNVIKKDISDVMTSIGLLEDQSEKNKDNIYNVIKDGGTIDQLNTGLTDITKQGGILEESRDAAISSVKNDLEPEILLTKKEVFGDEESGKLGLKETVFGEDGTGGIKASVTTLEVAVNDTKNGLKKRLKQVELDVNGDEGITSKVKALEYDFDTENEDGKFAKYQTSIEEITKNYIRNTVGINAMSVNMDSLSMDDTWWNEHDLDDPFWDGISIISMYAMQEITAEHFLSEVKKVTTELGEQSTVIQQTSEDILLAVKKDEVVSAINLDSTGIKIKGSRIEVGDGLIVEGDKVKLGNVTADHFFGKKVEGLEFISENSEQTERVIINSGKVVREKKDSFGDYQVVEKLVKMKKGISTCRGDWSLPVDFRQYNSENVKWGDVDYIAFITSQNNINSGEESIELREDYNSDTQTVKFKIVGGVWNLTNQTIANNWANDTIIIENCKEIDLNYVLQGKVYESLSKTLVGLYFSETVRLYLKINNNPEELIVTTKNVNGLLGNLVREFSEASRVRIRKEFGGEYDGGGRYFKRGERSVTLTGNAKVGQFINDQALDGVVSWLMIANS